MTERAYGFDNEKLLAEFGQACARTGISGSGLVINPMASIDRRRVRYLRGVLLARLQGQRPSFEYGDKVELHKGPYESISSLNRGPNGGETAWRGRTYTVRRVQYLGAGKWGLELDDTGLHYDASYFTKLQVERWESFLAANP